LLIEEYFHVNLLVFLEGKIFYSVEILQFILKKERNKTDGRRLVHFCKRNNIQCGYVFCATEVSQFSTSSAFVESHFGTFDSWDVYVYSFMTNKLFVLCRNKAPNCFSQQNVWKHLLLLCETEGTFLRKTVLIGASLLGVIIKSSLQFFIYFLSQSTA
jgi:hypothetical protein